MAEPTQPASTSANASPLHRLLAESLQPEQLEIRDDSDDHIGHPEAHKGGHFCVRIVSSKFAGLPLLQRHRLVYAAIGDLSANHIHAISIQAHTPEEAAQAAC